MQLFGSNNETILIICYNRTIQSHQTMECFHFFIRLFPSQGVCIKTSERLIWLKVQLYPIVDLSKDFVFHRISIRLKRVSLILTICIVC